MVLAARLVCLQRCLVLVVAYERVVIALAPLDRIRHRRPSYDQALVQDTREMSQPFQLPHECLLQLGSCILPELEQHCFFEAQGVSQ